MNQTVFKERRFLFCIHTCLCMLGSMISKLGDIFWFQKCPPAPMLQLWFQWSRLTLHLYLTQLDRDFPALGTWMTINFSLRRADILRNVTDWQGHQWSCLWVILLLCQLLMLHIQGVPGGKTSILGGHSIGHPKQKGVCVLFRMFMMMMMYEEFCILGYNAV
jgi:hypothetical protein